MDSIEHFVNLLTIILNNIVNQIALYECHLSILRQSCNLLLSTKNRDLEFRL